MVAEVTMQSNSLWRTFAVTFTADASTTHGLHILHWKGPSVESKWFIKIANIFYSYVTEPNFLCADVIVYSGAAQGSV